MKTIHIIMIMSILLLVGCSEQMSDIKEAVSGINSQAEKAKSAITMDAHTIRGLEIEFNGELFTVNDLFKNILRDVQWEYEKNNDQHLLFVKGTWKEPLFENHFSIEKKEKLIKDGKVYIQLTFENESIVANETTVSMKLEDEILVDEKGEEILYYLYEIYVNQKNE
ncbi:MAG: 23S rRNA methyltransferase [Lysinibacillus sp.]|nr:23S rRNA methyltransferase [Lysinibacillus sp.]